jgi:hypothetical protein
MEGSRPAFSDFLRDVMFQEPFGTPKSDDIQGLAVLNFCDDTNLELNDVDFGLLDFWNGDGFNTQYATPAGTTFSTDLSANMSEVCLQWRYLHFLLEQQNLP